MAIFYTMGSTPFLTLAQLESFDRILYSPTQPFLKTTFSVDGSVLSYDFGSLLYGHPARVFVQVKNGVFSFGNEVDEVVGNLYVQTIYGGGGADEIHGQGGQDSLYGGDGNDVVWLDGGRGYFGQVAVARGGFGSDFIGSFLLPNLNGTIIGAELYGEMGNDTLSLTSDTWNEVAFFGGAGDDLLLLTSSSPLEYIDSDLVIGAANGIEHVQTSARYIFYRTQSVFDLGTASFGSTATGTLLQFGAGADLFRAGSVTGTVDMGAGNDTVDAGIGDAVILAGDGDDLILAGDGNDTIWTSGGRDTVYGGLGDDRIGISVGNTGVMIRDDGGANLLVLQSARPGASGIHLARFADLGVDVLVPWQLDLEAGLRFSEFDDVIDLSRLKVAPILTRPEDPWTQVLDLGAGNDRYTGRRWADVVDGGAGDDWISTGLGKDFLRSGGGNDTLIGGDSRDTYEVQGRVSIIEAGTIAGGRDLVRASADFDLRWTLNVEDLTGIGTRGLKLTGNGLVNIITGTAFGDTIASGGGQSDSLYGAAGDDVYLVNYATTKVFEEAGHGLDRIVTSLTSFVASANVEELIYTGQASFTGTGSAGIQRIASGAGNDTLTGAGTLSGGAGDDTYATTDVRVVVVETSGGGHDVLNVTANLPSSITQFLMPAFVEDLTWTGLGRILGNDLGNEIRGGTFLDGGSGNDTLWSGSSSSFGASLTGGAGDDVLHGNVGNDTFILYDASDTYDDPGGTGIDTVICVSAGIFQLKAGIEQAYAAADNVAIVGTDAGETFYGTSSPYLTLFDGEGGEDWYYGGGGHDAYLFRTMDGSVDKLASFVAKGDSADIIAVDGGAGGAFAIAEGDVAAGAYMYLTAGHSIAKATRFYVTAATGDVWFDADGLGGAAPVRLATIMDLAVAATLTADNFLVL